MSKLKTLQFRTSLTAISTLTTIQTCIEAKKKKIKAKIKWAANWMWVRPFCKECRIEWKYVMLFVMNYADQYLVLYVFWLVLDHSNMAGQRKVSAQLKPWQGYLQATQQVKCQILIRWTVGKQSQSWLTYVLVRCGTGMRPPRWGPTWTASQQEHTHDWAIANICRARVRWFRVDDQRGP